MLSFDPINHSERENYKLLTGSIIPRPIAFVTSKTEDGMINAAPFSYFNMVAAYPPMISISIQRQKGIAKDTAQNIMSAKEFVVHIVDEHNVGEVNKTAASLSSNQSEIEIADLSLINSTAISVPGIKEAKMRYECTLEHVIELNGHEKVSSDLIIGKVVQYHMNREIYEDGRINQEKLAAVSRLAGSNYAKVGEVFSIKRPK